MMTKRIFELSLGDICVKFSHQWVLYNDDGITKRFKRNLVSSKDKTQILEVGSKSQEKVEYIGIYNRHPLTKKRVRAFDYKTEDLIGEYNSIKEASKALNISVGHISRYLNKDFVTQNHNMGFHFENIL